MVFTKDDKRKLAHFKYSINKGPLINYMQKDVLNALPDTMMHLKKFLQDVTVYVYDTGSTNNLQHLFIESQIRDALKISRTYTLFAKHDKNDLNRFSLKKFTIDGVPGRDGKKRRSNIITMHGLYDMLFKLTTRVMASDEFRSLVYVVLDHILFKGRAILTEVVDEIKSFDRIEEITNVKTLRKIAVEKDGELIFMKKRVEYLFQEQEQLDIENEDLTNRINYISDERDSLVEQLEVSEREKEELRVSSEELLDIRGITPSLRLTLFQERYMVPINLYLLRSDILLKPKELSFNKLVLKTTEKSHQIRKEFDDPLKKDNTNENHISVVTNGALDYNWKLYNNIMGFNDQKMYFYLTTNDKPKAIKQNGRKVWTGYVTSKSDVNHVKWVLTNIICVNSHLSTNMDIYETTFTMIEHAVEIVTDYKLKYKTWSKASAYIQRQYGINPLNYKDPESL